MSRIIFEASHYVFSKFQILRMVTWLYLGSLHTMHRFRKAGTGRIRTLNSESFEYRILIQLSPPSKLLKQIVLLQQ